MKSADRRRALGQSGEDAAAGWYLAHGWRVLARNWRCRSGELDLIAERDGVVAFCEVKTRTSDAFGVPAAAVTAAKQARIRGLALQWLRDAGRGVRVRTIRFDVAAVSGFEVEVLEGVF